MPREAIEIGYGCELLQSLIIAKRNNKKTCEMPISLTSSFPSFPTIKHSSFLGMYRVIFVVLDVKLTSLPPSHFTHPLKNVFNKCQIEQILVWQKNPFLIKSLRQIFRHFSFIFCRCKHQSNANKQTKKVKATESEAC